MFDDFKNDFYGYEFVEGSQVNFPSFKSSFPILVFDLTKQSDVTKTDAIDMSYFKLNRYDSTSKCVCVFAYNSG